MRAEHFKIYGNKTDAQTEEQKSLGSLFPPFSDASKCLDCSPVGPHSLSGVAASRWSPAQPPFIFPIVIFPLP